MWNFLDNSMDVELREAVSRRLRVLGSGAHSRGGLSFLGCMPLCPLALAVLEVGVLWPLGSLLWASYRPVAWRGGVVHSPTAHFQWCTHAHAHTHSHRQTHRHTHAHTESYWHTCISVHTRTKTILFLWLFMVILIYWYVHLFSPFIY